MNFKKSLFISAIFLNLFFLNPSKIQCGDSLFNYLDNADETELTTEIRRPAQTRVRDSSYQNVMRLLSHQLEIQNFISKPFYKRTSELLSRPILDEMQLQKSNLFQNKSTWNSSLFYNKYNSLDCSESSNQISSYINLDHLSDHLKNNPMGQAIRFIGKDLPRVVSLIRPFKIEERKIGIFFNGTKKIGNFYLEGTTPIYYQERNLFLTDEELRKLERDPLLCPDNNKEYTDEDNIEGESIRDHLIKDRFGLGDTKINLSYHVIRKDSFNLAFGINTTVPTAFSFQKKHTDRPEFDLKEISSALLEYQFENLHVTENLSYLKEYGNKFLFDIVDHFAAATLDAPLGENKHLSLGFTCNLKLGPSRENFSLENKTSVEYTFPRKRKRFFTLSIKRNWMEDYTIGGAHQENLETYERLLLDQLFPRYLDVYVCPGIKFKNITQMIYETEKWNFGIGMDIWGKTKEHLCQIEASSEISGRIRQEEAVIPGGLQAKVFATAKRKYEGYWFNFHIDYTVASTNIGKDYTLMIEYGVPI